MDGVLLAARLVLAAVFVFSGLTKLADLAGTRKAVRDFGLPEVLAAPVGFLLPLAEIAVAIALIPVTWAWAGAIGALVLLGLFIVAITVNLALGRKPDCHCFGQVASEPIGASTLVRNVVLAAIAAFILIEGHPRGGTSAVHWLTQMNTAEKVGLIVALLLGALLLAQWGFLLNLLRQNGRLLERMETLENAVVAVGGRGAENAPAFAAEPVAPAQPVYGLPVGSPAPPFVLSGLFGETHTLDSLRAQEKPVVIMFTDPGCGPCGDLLPDVARWQRDYDPRLTFALISRGSSEANRSKMAGFGVRNVLLQENDEVANAYQFPGTPSALMIQPDGTIGTPTVAGPEPIRNLVTSLIGTEAPAVVQGPPMQLLDAMPTQMPAANSGNGSQAAAPAAGIGQPAPALTLKDLDNHSVETSQLRGEKTALVFWNLGCGFCQQMLPDLKEWEKNKPADAPRVMLVSSGSVEDNRAMGLRSTVLLDQNFQAGSAFGAQGTPMALIIDENGKIASEVAAGAPGVFGLIGGGPPPSADAGAAPPPASGLKVGDPAPALEFNDLDNKKVSLSDFRGSNTLLLFWSNGCGFCQQMLPELKTWESNKPSGAPELIVISQGTVEENKAMGLKSTVVIDPNFQAGAAFNAGGTPMGVLIDEQGNVASEVAAGKDQVFALAAASNVGARPVS